MRIGILTFHRSINYGAVTQCYALCKQISKDFPSDTVEVIDYIPKWRWKKYKPTVVNYVFSNVSLRHSFLTNGKIIISKAFELIRHPERIKNLKIRYKAFQLSRKCLPLSEEFYLEDNLEVFRGKVYGKYDVIVVGSDCVWEWTTIPFPNAYYLPGNYGCKKMSYAASAGVDMASILPLQMREKLGECVTDFSYVGVRDTSTELMVKTVSKSATPMHNCDPTTLLDRKDLDSYRQIVKDKLLKAGADFSKPIIGIMGNEILGKLAYDIFGDNATYIGVYVPNKYCNVFLDNLEVLEWASSFGLFNLTFTTFFHGTMLSLVNETPVLSFDYNPEDTEHITKLHELYNRLSLPGFYHRGKYIYNNDDVEKLKIISQSLLNDPLRERIRSELKKERLFYNSFKNALKEMHNQ